MAWDKEFGQKDSEGNLNQMFISFITCAIKYMLYRFKLMFIHIKIIFNGVLITKYLTK